MTCMDCKRYEECKEKSIKKYGDNLLSKSNEIEKMCQSFTTEDSKPYRTYLFVFADDTIHEVENSPSLKQAIIETAVYLGHSTELFLKSIKCFEDDDVDGLIAIFNLFVANEYENIATVYVIEDVIYKKCQKPTIS